MKTIEMGKALRVVGDLGWDVEDPRAVPDESDAEFRVELHVVSGSGVCEESDGFCQGDPAEPTQGVLDDERERGEPDHGARELSPVKADLRDGVVSAKTEHVQTPPW